MDDELRFKDLRMSEGGVLLSECEMILECNRAHYRMYVLPYGNCVGFECMAIQFVSCTGSKKSVWDGDNLIVSKLFQCTAYFDGVRHLEFNRNSGDMDGYINYPDIESLCRLMGELKELEYKYCEVER